MWVVIVGRLFPDQDDVSLFGPFPTREMAQEFIEMATDEPLEEPHLWLDDVDKAELAYVNEVLAPTIKSLSFAASGEHRHALEDRDV